MPFFPRLLERINPHFYVYRNRYEMTFDSYPFLKLSVRPLPDPMAGSAADPFPPLPRDEEKEILRYFGFVPDRLMRIELRLNGTIVYTQETS